MNFLDQQICKCLRLMRHLATKHLAKQQEIATPICKYPVTLQSGKNYIELFQFYMSKITTEDENVNISISQKYFFFWELPSHFLQPISSFDGLSIFHLKTINPMSAVNIVNFPLSFHLHYNFIFKCMDFEKHIHQYFHLQFLPLIVQSLQVFSIPATLVFNKIFHPAGIYHTE